MYLRKAIIVATHPEDHSVDLVMCDDGARLSGVPVMAHSASARTGAVDMPEVKKTGDKWDITQRDGQDMEALVGFMGSRNPFVVGFVFPQVSQMTFKDKQRRFQRHQSDVYHTVDGKGNMELYHPNGTFIRIAEETAHEDLERKNFDESLALDRNKERRVHIYLEIAQDKAHIDIDPDGHIRIKCKSLTVDSEQDIIFNTPALRVSGDVTAGGVSLQSHTHGGVKSGGENSGPPAP